MRPGGGRKNENIACNKKIKNNKDEDRGALCVVHSFTPQGFTVKCSLNMPQMPERLTVKCTPNRTNTRHFPSCFGKKYVVYINERVVPNGKGQV